MTIYSFCLSSFQNAIQVNVLLLIIHTLKVTSYFDEKTVANTSFYNNH